MVYIVLTHDEYIGPVNLKGKPLKYLLHWCLLAAFSYSPHRCGGSIPLTVGGLYPTMQIRQPRPLSRVPKKLPEARRDEIRLVLAMGSDVYQMVELKSDWGICDRLS